MRLIGFSSSSTGYFSVGINLFHLHDLLYYYTLVMSYTMLFHCSRSDNVACKLKNLYAAKIEVVCTCQILHLRIGILKATYSPLENDLVVGGCHG